MAVKIRLQQTGSRNRRTYRVVVMDESKRRDGAVIEYIGHVNPLVKPQEVKIDMERVKYWKSKGALPTPGVAKLLG